MQPFIFSLAVTFLLSSCSLTSTTFIKPGEHFELGNNPHGSFKVRVKNISGHELSIWEAPIDGGRHSPVIVRPNQSVRIKVDKDTAVKIENKQDKEAAVKLKVTGDTGLSMGYNKIKE
jgi:hypothetical protein